MNWKLLLIIILAALLRFYQLGSIPPSLDWDEASLAYNAKALLETGKDEYGNSWPVTIRSFHDYKPALYTYTLIPVFKLLGTSEFAIRFPSALAGTLTVLLTYFLAKELFPGQKLYRYVAMLLVAVSPWHLQFSRVAFEANLALTFFIAGILFFLKIRSQSWWLPFSAVSFGFSLLAYHSTKIVTPALLLVLVALHFKHLLQNKKSLLVSCLIGIVFVIPVIRTLQLGVGQSRLSTVSFTTIDNLLDNSRSRIQADGNTIFSRLFNHRYLVYAKEIIGGYLDHYSLKFWFVEGDSITRHTAVGLGLLHWWTLPFLFIGMFSVLGQNHLSKRIIFAWFLLAPIASALTSGTPNSVRAIFFIPTLEIFTAIGLVATASKFPLFIIPYSLFIVINTATYFGLYYRHTPAQTSQAWQYGYKQMVNRVMSEKDKYERVIITNSYDQPYIYLLWYGDYSPRQWTNPGNFSQRFDKFEFRTIDWPQDLGLSNSLLVGAPNEIQDKSKTIWSINFLDGSPAFLAVDTL